MSRKIQWAVIGAGGIANRRTIPEGILKARNARLVAVMDADPERAQAVGRQRGVPHYANEKELLAHPGIEAVYIATPNYLHPQQAIAAMRLGKHVLCEKPLANTVRDTEAMIRAARQARVKLACGYMMRFHAAHRHIARLVRDGALGKLSLGRAQLTCWYPPIPGAWRQVARLGGGGAFMDMGSHCVDLLETFFGRTKRVHASTSRRVHRYEVEDTALVTLEFQSGAMAVVDNQFNVPDIAARNRLELYGSLGSVLCEGTIGQGAGGEVTLFFEKKTGGYAANQQRSASGGVPLKFQPVNTYRSEIEDFSDAILNRRKPHVHADEALWNLKVCLAAYRSARTGRVVRLDP
jgi:predicted dehydrogenase